MRCMRVAIGQMDVKLGEKTANIEKVRELLRRAEEEQADVICLPELFTTGLQKETVVDLAEPIPGETTEKLRELAQDHNMLIAGSILEKEGITIFNTAVLAAPEGLVGTYRKVHPFLEEANHITGGREYSVFDTSVGKIGLLVCYDAAFPEAARLLSLQGAQIILLPSNWMNPFLDQWRLVTSARALDNQVWLVATNRIGSGETYTYFGRSRIVSPYGKAVAECGEDEDVGVIEADLGKSVEFKEIVNFLRDRKPHTYLNIATSNPSSTN